MKCVRIKKGKIIRISDKKAKEMVEAGEGKYTPKNEWKNEKNKKFTKRQM